MRRRVPGGRAQCCRLLVGGGDCESSVRKLLGGGMVVRLGLNQQHTPAAAASSGGSDSPCASALLISPIAIDLNRKKLIARNYCSHPLPLRSLFHRPASPPSLAPARHTHLHRCRSRGGSWASPWRRTRSITEPQASAPSMGGCRPPFCAGSMERSEAGVCVCDALRASRRLCKFVCVV